MRAPIDRRGFLGRGAAALLLAGGLPELARAEHRSPALAPIEPMRFSYELDDEVRSGIGLRCASPVSYGGALEMSIEPHPFPEEVQALSVYVKIAQPHGPGEPAVSCILTPAELDAFIANLTALRDRARAEDIVPRREALS